MTDENWALDIPGMTYEQAVRFREVLLPDCPWGVVLIDPATFMLRGYDRGAVELMVKCFEAGLVEGNLSHADRMDAMSMVEDFQDWLERSSS
jgi:hypothetical protein